MATKGLLAGAVSLFLLLDGLPGSLHGQHFDLLIRNGQILDGSGNPEFRGDVGIRGDRIVSIGRLPGATADRVIDATGLHVVSGFVDIHSHADAALARPDGSIRSRSSPPPPP